MMKVLVNEKVYQDRRVAFKALKIDRKYIHEVWLGLKDHGKVSIPGFKFANLPRGSQVLAGRVVEKVEAAMKSQPRAKAKVTSTAKTKVSSRAKTSSKTKTKTKGKATASKDAEPAPAAPADGLQEHCAICDRVAFGNIVRIGFGRWRHSGCEPGSKPWCEYFERLPKGQRTPEGQLIYNTATAKQQEARA